LLSRVRDRSYFRDRQAWIVCLIVAYARRPPETDEVGFSGQQGEQGFQLRFGERVAFQHGGRPDQGMP